MKRRTFLATLGSLPVLGLNAGWARAATGGNMLPAVAVKLAAVDALGAGAAINDLIKLANTSGQPGLFRASLSAAPVNVPLLSGAPTEFWAYNGSLPGPLIEVIEGDTVEILFENRLPQATTVHWHGLPVPPEQDGNPHDPVPPGGKRLYRFVLPVGSAGTYWYHPHPHGDTPVQVYRGLAGAFIVRARSDPLRDIPERLLMISDLKLGADGRIAPNDADDEMNGREGQFALVNAQRQPVLLFDRSGRERWRIWNASSARYLRLVLPGAGITLVGTDGGLLERPVTGMTELLLAPAQRVEIIVEAGASKGRVELVAAPYNRGKMGDVPAEKAFSLLTLDFGKVESGAQKPLPARLGRIDDLGRPKAKKRVVFSEQMSMAGGGHSMKFLVNGKQFDMKRIDLVSRVNQVELWQIANEADMDHPFHIHGTQFQVIEREFDGKATPEPYRAWRDTVNLRPGETVRIKLVQRFKGVRMFHCHILEHEGAGMMGQLKVV
ncbi:MAG: multicopper oxidase family protein [Oxalobacteraceae bacterium]|nr:multicopper oxidase family protein [Oxalobacteraceae bacterium]